MKGSAGKGLRGWKEGENPGEMRCHVQVGGDWRMGTSDRGSARKRVNDLVWPESKCCEAVKKETKLVKLLLY